MAQQYGKWKIKNSLSEGGQGHIYLVEKVGDNVKGEYVLKRLKNDNRFHRFKKEIEAGLKLNHPNIIKVIDYDLWAERPFLVTKYYENGSLSHLNLHQYWTLEKLEIFKLICSGVSFAHKNGIIHRDLKPDNIFLDKNLKPVVGDFGICFFNDENDERFTITEEAVGPRYYMAPELEDGRLEDITAISDVYSLGKILYWLISNGKMFSREKLRDEIYDITKKYDKHEYYLINEYLDKMIVENQSDRFKDGNDVYKSLEILIRRINMNANSIDADSPQLCIYCGLGYYKRIINLTENENGHLMDNNDGLRSFGIKNAAIGGNQYWQVFVCDHCGNVQFFRPEYTDDKKRWIKK